MYPIYFLLILFLCSLPIYTQNEAKMDNYLLVIHGGAGTILKKDMTPELEQAYLQNLTQALEKGYTILQRGGTSLDAVEAAILVLEDSPLFNAGKGSVFTRVGTNEMDAAIMDGKTLKAGAVAGVTTIKNPIRAARKVMENSPHVFLIGRGAEEFAKEVGVEIVDPSYFFAESRFREWQEVKKEDELKTPGLQEEETVKPQSGTVGAVALDKYGNLAAGTSTGGMTNKRVGRVGDSPVIGAGTYANNKACAISATGHGEYFIRCVVAYDIFALMEYKGFSLTEAAREVVLHKVEQLEGRGGVIGVDKKGNMVMTFNTEGMSRGYIKADGKAKVFIYQEEANE